MNDTTIINMKVFKVESYFCQSCLDILLYDNQKLAARIVISNNDKNLTNLLDVFDVKYKDNSYIQDIEDKYCRVIIDNKTNKVIALQHIIKDNIIYYIEKKEKINDES